MVKSPFLTSLLLRTVEAGSYYLCERFGPMVGWRTVSNFGVPGPHFLSTLWVYLYYSVVMEFLSLRLRNWLLVVLVCILPSVNDENGVRTPVFQRYVTPFQRSKLGATTGSCRVSTCPFFIIFHCDWCNKANFIKRFVCFTWTPPHQNG